MTTAVEVRTHRSLDRIAKDIKAACKRLQEGMSESLSAAIDLGQELVEAQGQVPRGEWPIWVEKNTPLTYVTAKRYMQFARELPAIPPAKRSRMINLGIVDAIRLLADVNAEAYLTDPDKAQQKILNAANDGLIPKAKARKLVDDVCDLRDEIKKNGTTPTTAATFVKNALKKAIDYHARTPEQRKRVGAMDAFASIVKKGRAFTAALNGVIDSPHLEQLDQRAALFLLSTVWEAQLILDQIAGKHRRALKNADDAVLQKLCEVENVRSELE